MMDRRMNMGEFILHLTVNSLSGIEAHCVNTGRSNTQNDSEPCLAMRICFISQLFVVLVIGVFSDNKIYQYNENYRDWQQAEHCEPLLIRSLAFTSWQKILIISVFSSKVLKIKIVCSTYQLFKKSNLQYDYYDNIRSRDKLSNFLLVSYRRLPKEISVVQDSNSRNDKAYQNHMAMDIMEWLVRVSQFFFRDISQYR